MSKITGVPDFKDIYDQYGNDFLKKLHIYIGYHNYLFNNPIDTSKYQEEKDWVYLFHYCVLSKSIYKTLESGYIVLYTRDYLSIQEDEAAWRGGSKKLRQQRQQFHDWLLRYGFTEEEATDISRYRFELEYLKEEQNNETK